MLGTYTTHEKGARWGRSTEKAEFFHTQWQYTHTRIYVMVLWFIGRKAIPSFPPREVLQEVISLNANLPNLIRH